MTFVDSFRTMLHNDDISGAFSLFPNKISCLNAGKALCLNEKLLRQLRGSSFLDVTKCFTLFMQHGGLQGWKKRMTRKQKAYATIATYKRTLSSCAASVTQDLDLKDSECCSVCLVSRKTHAFIPCGHMCVCLSCGAKLDRCPLCKVKAKRMHGVSVYKIYS
mgnify:CR=1 FL=1